MSSAEDLMASEVEMEAITDLFNKLTKTCQTKCLSPKYTDGQLTKGESVCLDRCVAKFLEVHNLVGKKMNEMQQMQQEQA